MEKTRCEGDLAENFSLQAVLFCRVLFLVSRRTMKGKFQESGQLRKELWKHKEAAKNKDPRS